MAVLGLGCVAAASPRATLVFIHGLKGAKLATDSGRVRWLTALQALGLSTPSLALAPRFDAGVQPRDDLAPVGVLSAIVSLPRLIQVPVRVGTIAACRVHGRGIVCRANRGG